MYLIRNSLEIFIFGFAGYLAHFSHANNVNHRLILVPAMGIGIVLAATDCRRGAIFKHRIDEQQLCIYG